MPTIAAQVGHTMILTKSMDSSGNLARATRLENKDVLLLLQSQYLKYVWARSFYLYMVKLREEKSGLRCCSAGAIGSQVRKLSRAVLLRGQWCPWKPEGSDLPGAGVTDECELPDVWMLRIGLRSSRRAVYALNNWAISPSLASSFFFPLK